jgi:hypothetical protein
MRHMRGCFSVGLLAAFKDLLRCDGRKDMQETGDDPCPSGLVAGAETGPIVAVEVLMNLSH